MIFDSFWIAGFETAQHVNRAGTRLDMVAATQHDSQVDEDYGRLRDFGIRTVRDAARWPLIERAGRFDLSSFVPMLRAAVRQRVQVVWTLCHYGWPDDVDALDRTFPDRFARYCRAVATCVRDETEAPPLYTPINEISFLAWAAGKAGLMAPFARNRDGALKKQLVRAALAGSAALRDVDPRARLVYVDPVINVVAPVQRPVLQLAASRYTETQYEAWDMLLGRREPSLGGHAGAIDVMGLNFYHANQWEHPRGRLRWEDEPRDARWIPLHRLVQRVYERYRLPVFIGETSHFGAGRVRWILEVAEEVRKMHENGVPLQGVCLYPIIDRPDWDNAQHWHHSGLWDVQRRRDGVFARVLNEEYAAALREVQRRVQEPSRAQMWSS